MLALWRADSECVMFSGLNYSLSRRVNKGFPDSLWQDVDAHPDRGRVKKGFHLRVLGTDASPGPVPTRAAAVNIDIAAQSCVLWWDLFFVDGFNDLAVL